MDSALLIREHRPRDVWDGDRLEPPPRARDPKKFDFVEREAARPVDTEPGLQAFLEDLSLRGDATGEEIEFLGKLRFTGRRPTPLYYYRELQNLRDPLHFRRASTEEQMAETQWPLAAESSS